MSIRVSLQLHPGSRCDPLTGIEVEIARINPLRLELRYVLRGAAHKIRTRPPRDSVRADPLWMHSCFEAFLRVGGEEEYLEFNLAPTGDWAAWRFRRYREGMEPAKGVGASILSAEERRRPMDPQRRAQLEAVGFDTLERFEPSFFSLRTGISFDRAMGLALDVPWHLGLSAVVEERNGRMSYWALHHPPGAPDFHHPDCFALQLPAARPDPSPRT